MKRFGILLGVFFELALGSALPAHAEDAAAILKKGLTDTNKSIGFKEVSVTNFVGQAIQTVLSLTGLIFLIITVYAGILYMTAGGEGKKVEGAKKMLVQAVIGIIICVGAYALTSFVIQQAGGIVGSTPSP